MENTKDLQSSLSSNLLREKRYRSFLEKCANHMTVKNIAHFGSKLMHQEKLHYHFFEDHSLFKNALYLTFFSLNLPYEYQDSKYLKRKISKEEAISILKLFERRISERVPVQYITHEAYYSGYKFFVNKNVLVPRSLMNSQFEDFLSHVHWENYRVLDLCTGSGCIGITLALLNPNIKVDLVDISSDALEVASANVKYYGLQDRVRCIQSDLFTNLHDKYDLIITNPPYVPEIEYAEQPLEVKNEPKIALVAGKDGLDILHQILTQAKKYLNPNGMLIAEVGYSAAITLKKKYPKVPFQWRKCKGSKDESLLYKITEFLIQWTPLLDSIFLCEAKGLPD
ncbi:MAG: hypothetical protein BGO43_15390 [Gammaproteobacteria bacterium 39-13]|nr:50S ribosomal protein L3 N(5)-glutamine methyltransferase [Gammaproteobacteria bacterium]OJV87799.1 MAG: hypothetical protein BGO43_15390 [Gammaproteobacteria bacterium 39-13]